MVSRSDDESGDRRQLKRQTPILASQIASAVLNPAWHVPSTILHKDIVQINHDPEYLTKEVIDIYDYEGTRRSGLHLADEAISAVFLIVCASSLGITMHWVGISSIYRMTNQYLSFD